MKMVINHIFLEVVVVVVGNINLMIIKCLICDSNIQDIEYVNNSLIDIFAKCSNCGADYSEGYDRYPSSEYTWSYNNEEYVLNIFGSWDFISCIINKTKKIELYEVSKKLSILEAQAMVRLKAFI